MEENKIIASKNYQVGSLKIRVRISKQNKRGGKSISKENCRPCKSKSRQTVNL